MIQIHFLHFYKAVPHIDDHVNKVKFEVVDEKTSNSSLLVVVLVILTILSSCGVWMLYAYRNPHTKSGQLLIRVSCHKNKILLLYNYTDCNK